MKATLGPLQPADTRQGEAWSSDFPGSSRVPTGHDRYQNADANYVVYSQSLGWDRLEHVETIHKT